MKRIITLLIIIITYVGLVFGADNDAEMMLKRATDAISDGHSIEANISVTTPGLDTPSKGVIKLQGNMTRLIMPDFMMWYDGTTMWAYSEATGEVNITSPSADELISISPYAALHNYQPVLYIKKKDKNTILLTPKNQKTMPWKVISLHIDDTSGYINKAVLVDTNGANQTIIINNYKKGNKLPESAFKFNKAEVPQGTPIIDLR